MVMCQALNAKIPIGILDKLESSKNYSSNLVNSRIIGEHIMELKQDEVFPEWMSTSGIDFWEPDKLYIEWLIFLYGIWESVDYL